MHSCGPHTVSVQMLSKCSKCGEADIHYEGSLDELVLRLRTGAPMQAHCMACDGRWELSGVERAEIARTLNK